MFFKDCELLKSKKGLPGVRQAFLGISFDISQMVNRASLHLPVKRVEVRHHQLLLRNVVFMISVSNCFASLCNDFYNSKSFFLYFFNSWQ